MLISYPTIRSCALAVLLCAPQFTWADDVTTDNPTMSYLIVNQRIDGFLPELARDATVRIQHSASVRGRIINRTLTGSPEQILGQLGIVYGLDWFAYNNVYFVSNQTEAVTRMIQLGDLSLQDAMDALDQTGLIQDRYPVAAMSEDTGISVTGPPKYVAFIESVIESLPSAVPEVRAVDSTIIRVRRAMEVENVALN